MTKNLCVNNESQQPPAQVAGCVSLEMGDMKTPDFEDLLAAFDIPDIEAIQSSPEEERNEAVPHGGLKDKGPHRCSPVDSSDLPTVSVIVKNTVRTDTLGFEKGRRVQNDFKIHNSTKGDYQFTDSELDKSDDVLKVTNGLRRTESKEMTSSTTNPLPQDLTGCTLTAFDSPNYSHDVEHSMKPTLHPHLSISGSVTEELNASSSFSPLPPPASPPIPPQSSQGNVSNNSNPTFCSSKARVNSLSQSDEDFQSDLEGPLVIQESPESPESTVDLLESSEKTSCLDLHKSASPIPNNPEPQQKEAVQPATTSSLLLDEKYPEHVIDERDSPESPPPSETGMMNPKINPSPEPPNMDVGCKEQSMKNETCIEHKTGVADDLNSKVQGKFTNSVSLEDTTSTIAVSDLSSLSPVKVKMKKPAGGLTRAVTGVASKKRGRAKTGAGKTLKKTLNTLSECHDTRSRKGVLKQSKSSLETNTVKRTRLKMSSTSESKTPAKVAPPGVTLRSLGHKAFTDGMALPQASASSLLPPLSSNKPASIVNSTGAIISKSQTNLVEAFNRILNNKNLLPCYKPDLTSSRHPEWGISLPAQGYRCLECGDAFALEQSLARHYDRRSLRIEVTCNHCAKRLAFFNKCSLLLHAREHKERGLIMQCSHLVMKPVPLEQMISQREPTTIASSSILCQPNPNTVALKNKEVQYCNNQCPECHTEFNSPREVAEHFQELNSSQSITCTDCSPPMLLSNSCCSAAHQRIHQDCPPHVCPECGGTVKPSAFKTHLDETCFHFARRIGYRCSSCLVVFGGLNSVKSHIQQAHCDMFHKCPSCPMAFKSAPSIQSHIAAQHPTVKESQAMLIYKCVMCDTVFTHKSLLYVHFDTHLSNQKVHVFKCPECTKLFSLRSSLMDHFKTHSTKNKYESAPIALPQSQLSVKMESSEGEECANQAKKTLKQFPCNKCESSFATTSSLRRHIRDKHKPVTRNFRCQFCTDVKKTFSSRAMLEKHIQLRHNFGTGDCDNLMEGGDEADSSSEQDGSSGFRRRRRAVVKLEQEEESVNGVSQVKKWRSSSAPRADSLPEKGFCCAPCGFTCEDQAVFLEHISQHRKGTGSGTQQCLQCGVCFTSNFSLSRHHFIVHKVRDPDNQDGPNCPAPSPDRNHDVKGSHGCSAPASPAFSQGKDSEGALACKVCGKQFEKTTDLNTHFRTHGMAFINARKTT